MTQCRALCSKELRALNEWLAKKEIKLNNRTRLELADVVNIARLVKKNKDIFINVYKYSSHNGANLKLDNWKMFNSKVLRKLGFKLSLNELEQLASGSLNALRLLFYHLMSMDHQKLVARSPIKVHLHLKTSKSKVSQVHKMTNRSFTGSTLQEQFTPNRVPKNIPYLKHKLLLHEINTKKKYINSASHRLKYLQSLILVKEERIKYLEDRLEKLKKHSPIKNEGFGAKS